MSTSQTKTQVNVDIAVIGGGIAGLWILSALKAKGYHAVLLEQNALGFGQTICSQGILHGGTKYALTGKITGAAEAIFEMPAIWKACLDGQREPNLKDVRVISDHQWLWSTQSLSSKLAGFFASRVMKSKVAHVAAAEGHSVFQHPTFKGQLYRLEEMVLDVPALLEAFRVNLQDSLIKVDSFDASMIHDDESLDRVTIDLGNGAAISAKRVVFAAGVGNEQFAGCLGKNAPKTQRRPLHMVMIRKPISSLADAGDDASGGGGNGGGLCAHCLGAGATPRLTITTQYAANGDRIWCLGGKLADEGIDRDTNEQIRFARKEVLAVLPNIDLSDATWATFRVDRAEQRHTLGHRPDTQETVADGKFIITWPTKMVLAPQLADDVLGILEKQNIQPTHTTINNLTTHCDKVHVATPPWEEVAKWIADDSV